MTNFSRIYIDSIQGIFVKARRKDPEKLISLTDEKLIRRVKRVMLIEAMG
jgi:hypothetical protein